VPHARRVTGYIEQRKGRGFIGVDARTGMLDSSFVQHAQRVAQAALFKSRM